MKTIDKVFIWLSICELDFATVYNLFQTYPNIEKLWDLEEYKGLIIYYLTQKDFNQLMKVKNDGRLERTLSELEKGKIKYVCIYDEMYPVRLKDLDYPPFVLYYVGDISLASGRNVGIVGSRVCTRYGKEQTERFSRDFGNAGFCVVSGLSEGVDTIAHQTAVQNNKPTIAVVANGLKSIFPAMNVNLAREIVRGGGLLMSEFHPDYVPKSFAFVQRNRLIAALCEGVLVTEARKDSGALHTANFAIDLGRSLFAIPGNINSFASEGCNDLIKNFHSTCVTTPAEVIEKLNGEVLLREIINQNQRPVSKIDKSLNLKPEESKVIEFLQKEDAHLDEIAKILQFDTKKLLVLLTTMEIRGLIKKLPGNYYGKKD